MANFAKKFKIMTREEKIRQSVDNKAAGYNCAQAVACSFCQEAGLDEETMRRATAAYGAGMGCMEGTCGALTGAAMVVGLINKEKAPAMAEMKKIMTAFKAKNGSTICRELKGIGTGKPLRDCPGCVADAAGLLFDELEAGGVD